MSQMVLAIDQGTTSTRAMIFGKDVTIRAVSQTEHRQIFPQQGWVEHDPEESWANTIAVVDEAMAIAKVTPADIAAIGVTNQRETTIVWDKATGQPVANALVWQDTRSQDIIDEWAGRIDVPWLTKKTGLPLATYFSASKIAWLFRHHPNLRERAEAGEILFGTPDTWVVWNLTGGVNGGLHLTDVTNASRTLLMDLDRLDWDDELLAAFDIPRAMLPQIRPSVGHFGQAQAPASIAGVPIAGILGDQQAATFGQVALTPGTSKSTYGTGSFLIVNTGEEIVRSHNGLITTVAYQIDGHPAQYALEGSVAVAGSLVQWLRDNVGVISDAAQVEELARSVDDNGGVYIVPAFSGLFAPHWRSDARGVIVGLTRFANRSHIARAALESTAFQTRDVLDAANSDMGVDLVELRVDGGMTRNDLLMQFQADILGIPVVRPVIEETTALGAAFAAGLAVGFWANTDELSAKWKEAARFEPQMPVEERERRYRVWQKAVTKSVDWVDDDTSA